MRQRILQTGDAGIALLLLLFTFLVAPLIWLNNRDINTVTAAYYDSGSILGCELGMLAPDHFYNQNVGFHSSTYGWAPNSLIFLQFAYMKFHLHLDVQDHLATYAAVAKLNSFIFSLGALAAFYFLVIRLAIPRSIALILTLLMSCFSGFPTFASQIHPEPLGLFCMLVTFHGLLSYLQTSGQRSILFMTLFWATISALSKPPFAIALIPPIGIIYLSLRIRDRKPTLSTFIRSEATTIGCAFLLVTSLVFLVHPYLFFDFTGFMNSMQWVYAHHYASIDRGVARNCWIWLRDVVAEDPLLICGLVASILTITSFRSGSINTRRFLRAIACSNLAFLIWLFSSVKAPILMEYLYPVFPSFLLLTTGVIVTHLNETSDKRRRSSQIAYVGTIMALVALTSGAAHVSSSIAQTIDQRHFSSTADYAIGDAINRLGKQPWRILCSSSIPIHGDNFDMVIDEFALTAPREKLAESFRQLGLTTLIDDDDFSSTRKNELIAASREAGLLHEYVIAAPGSLRQATGWEGLTGIPHLVDRLYQRGPGHDSFPSIHGMLLSTTPITNLPPSIYPRLVDSSASEERLSAMPQM